MMHTFTPVDLVAYLYGESTPAQQQATEDALDADPLLERELSALQRAKAHLPRPKFQARKRLLTAIKGYASASLALN